MYRCLATAVGGHRPPPAGAFATASTPNPWRRRHAQVGSEDFDIRCFQNEDVVGEIPEADAVVALAAIMERRFAYGLANGTIGAYDGYRRAWRVKSKHSVCVVSAYDMDGDGVAEHISGWSNGRVCGGGAQGGGWGGPGGGAARCREAGARASGGGGV